MENADREAIVDAVFDELQQQFMPTVTTQSVITPSPPQAAQPVSRRREQGTDITARRDGRGRSIEVKGTAGFRKPTSQGSELSRLTGVTAITQRQVSFLLVHAELYIDTRQRSIPSIDNTPP